MKNRKAAFPFRLRNSGWLNGWILGSLFSALLISLPLFIVFVNIFKPEDEIWRHIATNLLSNYIFNSLILLLGVGGLTFVIGVGLAWLVSMYEFPGKTFFSWALILPIALPAYISGFTWAGILDYTSPVYVFFRQHLGVDTGQYLFFDILSVPGAILIFSLALYPYVYLITRAYFVSQSGSFLEAATSLGHSGWSVFRRVAIPMARPAYVAGVSLVLMEVLNDYGLVRYFGVDTFTTGIFTAWFSFGNPVSALKLSAYLMLFVFLLIFLEKSQRGRMRFDTTGNSFRPVNIEKPGRLNSVIILTICALPFLLGFLIPFLMLVYWSIQTATTVVDNRFTELTGNSFLLAGMASITILVFAVFISFTVRTFPSRFARLLAGISTLGYALPGAVVAMGLLILFISTDTFMINWFPLRLIFTGTWFALIFAYLVRFMAVGYNNVDSGMERISRSVDEASRSLGRNDFATLRLVNLPLLKGALLSGFLLVFIDVLKELPLTLILRPFNFDTLAIRAFEFASDERVPEAAPAAVIIVLIGIVPVLLLNKMMNSGK